MFSLASNKNALHSRQTLHFILDHVMTSVRDHLTIKNNHAMVTLQGTDVPDLGGRREKPAHSFV